MGGGSRSAGVAALIGLLEREQESAADLQRIVDALEPRS